MTEVLPSVPAGSIPELPKMETDADRALNQVKEAAQTARNDAEAREEAAKVKNGDGLVLCGRCKKSFAPSRAKYIPTFQKPGCPLCGFPLPDKPVKQDKPEIKK